MSSGFVVDQGSYTYSETLSSNHLITGLVTKSSVIVDQIISLTLNFTTETPYPTGSVI